MNSKGKMGHSCLLVVTVIIIQLTLNATAQYTDDNVSAKKLRLQDIENEQNHEELERLQQQQPPLQLPNTNTNLHRAFPDRIPNIQTAFRSTAQSVRPLEQKVTLAKPIRPVDQEHVTGAASSFNFGISPLANNDLDDNAHENDIDTDIVTYSHDDPPFPFNLRRPQLELLSSGGAGYALTSADVLVPPFRDDEPQHISDEERPLTQLVPGRYVHPFVVNSNRPLSQYAANEAQANELPEVSAGTIEYSSGYLPVNQLSSQRPIIQYGSPHADFRRPNVYTQSNQLAFAPIRSESGTLMSGANIPYPPSFISITTRRPETEFNGNAEPPAVRPLGRSLEYGKPFRPSAVDPVPDFFANRQSKSLLDSYIPSWIVARMIEQQSNNGYANHFGSSLPYSRYFKRSDMAQVRKDDFNTEIESKKST